MNRTSYIVWSGIGTLFIVFLLSPLTLVVLFAFTSRPQSAFPIEALSFRWWDAMLASPNFTPAFENSLVISGTVGIVSAIVGTMAALGLAQLDQKRAGLVAAVLCLAIGTGANGESTLRSSFPRSSRPHRCDRYLEAHLHQESRRPDRTA